jgi:hypothetical protein
MGETCKARQPSNAAASFGHHRAQDHARQKLGMEVGKHLQSWGVVSTSQSTQAFHALSLSASPPKMERGIPRRAQPPFHDGPINPSKSEVLLDIVASYD